MLLFIRRNYIATTLYLAIFYRKCSYLFQIISMEKTTTLRSALHISYLLLYFYYSYYRTHICLSSSRYLYYWQPCFRYHYDNIFMIELCLFSLPALLLCNFYTVYPNLQFLCSLYGLWHNYFVFEPLSNFSVLNNVLLYQIPQNINWYYKVHFS